MCAIALGAAEARAQSVEAEALFNEGDRMMAAGKLAEACDAFQASNRLEPRAGTLIRLGECREQNGQLASAWSAYRDALTRVKDPRKKAFATAKAAELEKRLSSLTITVPETDRRDGLVVTRNGKEVDPALWNRPMPVDGGDYVIVARAPGRREWSKTVAVPVEGGAVSVELFVEPEPVAPVVTNEPAAPAPTPAPAVVVEPRDDANGFWGGLTPKRKLAVGLAGGGAVALITGATFGALASSKQSEGRDLCPEPQACADADRANELIDAAQSRAAVANVAYVLGTAALIGGGVLWFLGAPDPSGDALTVTPAVDADQAGFVFSGRF